MASNTQDPFVSQIQQLLATHAPDGIATRVKSNKDLALAVIAWPASAICVNWSEKIYCYVNSLEQPPLCACGQSLTFVSITTGYREFCSRSCDHAKSAATQRRIAKMKSQGGVGLANPNTKAKATKTLQQIYGDDIINPSQILENREKLRINNPMHRQVTKDKIKQTTLLKYGVDNVAKLHYSPKTIEILNDKESLKELFLSMPICDISAKLGVSDGVILKQLHRFDLRKPHQSSPELQLREYLTLLGCDDFKKDRKILKGKELDFYSASLNVAIEYCGLYYHSESVHLNRKYHREKYLQCKEAGIKVVTIFENEWIHRPNIVLSRIKHLVKRSETGIGARKLAIKEIDTNIARQFLEVFHIDGYANTLIKFGAFYRDELVAVMTFGKNNRVNSAKLTQEWEMVRFATNGKNYPGVAGKLLSTFIKSYNPTSILSYSNLRYGEGDYLKYLGFIRNDKDTNVGYWYFKNNEYKLYHRSNFTKDNIIRKFPMIDFTAVTDEYSMAKRAGLDRIWDCGNAVWSWNKK